jgi:hypothetical protein
MFPASSRVRPDNLSTVCMIQFILYSKPENSHKSLFLAASNAVPKQTAYVQSDAASPSMPPRQGWWSDRTCVVDAKYVRDPLRYDGWRSARGAQYGATQGLGHPSLGLGLITFPSWQITKKKRENRWQVVRPVGWKSSQP